jgi:hypothetical protein
MAVGNETINYRITAQDNASAVFQKLQGTMSGMSVIGANFGRIIGALGVGLSLQQAASAMKNLIDKADGFKDISQKTGVAVETLSQFSQVAENSGTSIDAVAIGLKKLSSNMVQASAGNREMLAIFDALNVSFKDSQGNLRDTGDVMMDIGDRFTTMEDGALKSATAVKLFGKAGSDLVPMLNEGSKGVTQFSAVIDTEFAEASDKFNENIKSMQNSIEKGLVDALKKVLPLINDFIESQNNMPSFDEIVVSGVQGAAVEEQQRLLSQIQKTTGELEAAKVRLANATDDVTKTLVGSSINILTTLLSDYQSALGKLDQQVKQLGASAEAAGIQINVSKKPYLNPDIGTRNPPMIKPKALALAVGGGTGGTDELKKFLEDQRASIELLKLEGQQASMTSLDYKLLTDQQKFKSELDKLLIGKSGEKVDAFRAEAMALQETKIQLMEANQVYKQSIEGGFMEGLAKIREKAMDVGGQISDAMTNAFSGMEDALVSFVMTGKADFKSLANSIISDLIRIQIRSMLGGMFGGGGGFNLGSLFGMGGGGGQFSFGAGGYTGMGPFMAKGGPVSANSPYIVGEKGPELFMPGSSGSIVPNNKLGGGSDGVTINQTINISTGVQQTVRAEIQQLLPQISNAAKNAVVDAKRRGGSFAMAFGG